MTNKTYDGKINPEVLREVVLYNPDTGLLYWKPRPRSYFPEEWQMRAYNTRHSGKRAFQQMNASGHLEGKIFCKHLKAHRAAWAIYYGEWPKQDIDHINGNPSDNRICNLRDISRAENSRNQKLHRNNKSGVIGVSYHATNNRWGAYITHDKKRRHLGSFVKKSDAISARKKAERELGFHPNHGRVPALSHTNSKEG